MHVAKLLLKVLHIQNPVCLVQHFISLQSELIFLAHIQHVEEALVVLQSVLLPEIKVERNEGEGRCRVDSLGECSRQHSDSEGEGSCLQSTLHDHCVVVLPLGNIGPIPFDMGFEAVCVSVDQEVVQEIDSHFGCL